MASIICIFLPAGVQNLRATNKKLKTNIVAARGLGLRQQK